jgi:hypothetical protein
MMCRQAVATVVLCIVTVTLAAAVGAQESGPQRLAAVGASETAKTLHGGDQVIKVRASGLGEKIVNINLEQLQPVNSQTLIVPHVLGGSNLTIFSDNFEGSFPGQWQFGFSWGADTSVRWGRSTCRAASGIASMWCAAGGSNAQWCGGTYLPNMGTFAEYGPFSLADATAATLDFDLWLNSEAIYDYVSWGISVDGTNFHSVGYYGNSGGWVHENLNFSTISGITAVGAPQVWVAFIFTSDLSRQYEGAYVDNVVIAKTTMAGCQPNATTLCIDGTPGDRRYRVQASYQTAQGGGLSGSGQAIPLSSVGVTHGGLFWFFSADNPELLIKVLNGCSNNGSHWVYGSAGTNVGVTITVTDTVTGVTKIYTNPDLHPMTPIQDNSALPCP